MKNEKVLLQKIEDFINFKNFIKKTFSGHSKNISKTIKKIKNFKRFLSYSVQEKFKLSLYYRIKKKSYMFFFYVFTQEDFNNQDYFSIARYHNKKYFFWGDIFSENFSVLGIIGGKNFQRYSEFFSLINWQILQLQTRSYTQFLFYDQIVKKRIFRKENKNILYQNTELEIRNNFRFILKYQIIKWIKKGGLFIFLKNSFKKIFHKKKEKILGNFERNLSIFKKNFMLNMKKKILTREFLFYIYLILVLSNRDRFFIMLIAKNTSSNIKTLFFEKIRKSLNLNKEKIIYPKKIIQEYFFLFRQKDPIYLDLKSKNKYTKNKILSL
jgi:hypothetical protein